ncbi:hypothetical protein GTP55_25655 [Duganella sp. FT109W]|uniref:Uncharacterized protein n=1 Tax=Duganella margarita TaxID=2692170 RepID=A0ABW9WNC0_9BURK|nr:hypothetical protein [Duganella margarita]MYN42734.1 hypothetical protein [Duganella margarita]
MAIINLNLPALGATAMVQNGTFSTDTAADVSTTLSANAVASASTLSVASSAGFATGAELVTIPGAGPAGATAFVALDGLNLFGANQLSCQNQSIVTGVASGTAVTMWGRIALKGTPKHVRLTQANGDWWDWVQGMEPYSVNSSVGGVTGLLTNKMLCCPGAVNFAPSFLAASTNYSILIEY